MARARLRHALSEFPGAIADLDEAWQIAEHGPMPLYQADILLHRVRLFGIIGAKQHEQKYPWLSSAEADLQQAATLIDLSKYGRRRQELIDAEAALRGKPS